MARKKKFPNIKAKDISGLSFDRLEKYIKWLYEQVGRESVNDKEKDKYLNFLRIAEQLQEEQYLAR